MWQTAPVSTPPRRPSANSKSAPQGPASRRRREVLIALLALPVLLVLGLFVGNALTDDDTVDVASGTPVGATPTLTTPAVQGPSVPTSSATSEPSTPAPSTPAATSDASETTPAPTTPAATTAPAPTEEASAEPSSAEPSTTAPPSATPTSTPPRASPSPTAPPSDAPDGQADEGSDGEAADGDGDSSTQARAAPQPDGGDDIVYARGSAGEDVRVWQGRMRERGWILRADGIFGPRTESVVRDFQAEKGLRVDGVLGVNTWDAAWTEPIT